MKVFHFPYFFVMESLSFLYIKEEKKSTATDSTRRYGIESPLLIFHSKIIIISFWRNGFYDSFTSFWYGFYLPTFFYCSLYLSCFFFSSLLFSLIFFLVHFSQAYFISSLLNWQFISHWFALNSYNKRMNISYANWTKNIFNWHTFYTSCAIYCEQYLCLVGYQRIFRIELIVSVIAFKIINLKSHLQYCSNTLNGRFSLN